VFGDLHAASGVAAGTSWPIAFAARKLMTSSKRTGCCTGISVRTRVEDVHGRGIDGIAAIDLFVLPTITFQILYCLIILRHTRSIVRYGHH